jgi:hypothetical protein
VGAILRSASSLRDAGEALLAAANEAGGRDNITVVLFRLGDARDGTHTADDQTHATAPQETVVHRTQTTTVSQGWDEILAQSSVAGTVARRAPRVPAAQTTEPPKRLRLRRLGFPVAALVVMAVLGCGAYLASQSVYFIATNSRGLITIYNGFPFTLPGHLNLYSEFYVSGVPASSVPGSRRRTLLDHSLRSESNAATLVRSLELEQSDG